MMICEQKKVELVTGDLELNIHKSDFALDELCGFASRYNPIRGYLFVSKVLGKHYPVRPALMGRVHELLAEKIVALGLEEPVLVIGMAETATGLGQGIFEACLDKQPAATPAPWIFLHTTRYTLTQPLAFQVTEEHCHARDHLVYEPVSEEGKNLFYSAKTLVMVDDEMSTGKTLLNLATQATKINPGLKRLILATITCWLNPEEQKNLLAGFSRPGELVSLLDGSFKFTPRATDLEMPAFKSVGNWEAKDYLLAENYGRLGWCASQYNPTKIAAQMAQLASNLTLDQSRPVLVLGTGEFIHQPYLLARFLEGQGYQVSLQSTTRTPVVVGHDIKSALQFVDNYHDDIDNFLYNVQKDSTTQVVICYETSPLPPKHNLAETLGAQVVYFAGI